MACPSLSIDADASLATTLASLDCQVNGAVASGYGHLFAAGGGLGAALTIGLSIYVAVIALGLLSGHTRLTIASLGPKVLGLGFVLAFATGWPAYQAVVYGLLTGGPDQIASAFLGAKSGATNAFAGRLDQLFSAVIEIGQSLASAPKAPNLGLATNLVWISALILLISTLGLLIIVKLVLAVLLALGPVFIVFALFGATRGLFEGWLRTSVGFAFAPLLVVLGGSGLLGVLGPVIAVVADDPLGAVADVRPVVTLFLAVVIYAGLVVTLMGVALALTRGWRVPLGRSREPSSAPLDAASSATGVRQAFASQHSTASRDVRELRAANDDRVSGIATAMLREETRTVDHRMPVAVEATAASAPHQSGAARRVEGLGQTFRPAPGARALSGTIGS